MEQRLHGHLTRQITEQSNAIIGAFISSSVAKRRHLIGKVHHIINVLYTFTSGRSRRRLRHSINADILLTTIDIAETTRDTLQQTLGICHVIVAEERAV